MQITGWVFGAVKVSLLIAHVLGQASFANSSEKKDKRPVVFVETAVKSEIFDPISYPAKIVSNINANLLAETEGVIQKISVRLGDRIHKKSEVLRLRHTDPVYEYAPVRVLSPVNGVVSAIEVTEGSRVSQGQKLATVMDPDQLKVVIEIAAEDLQTLKAGMEGSLELTSIKQPLKLKIQGISPLVDPGTGTATAELVVVDKLEMPLSPGLIGKVAFEANKHLGFQVPDDAVVHRSKRTFLRFVSEETAKLVEIETGPIRRGMTEIVSGLSGGEVYIVRASDYVADGEKVTVETLNNQQLE